MRIDQQIKEQRQLLGMTQEELAEKLNVSRSSVANWESGRNYPDIGTILLLSEVFHLTVDELLKGDKTMVKKIDHKIKRGNQYRGILVVFGIVVGVLFLVTSWYNYRNAHLEIVPLQDIQEVSVSSRELTEDTLITGQVVLEKHERIAFSEVELEDNQMFIMVHKEPYLLKGQDDFEVSMKEIMTTYGEWVVSDVTKINLVYYDNQMLQGVTKEQLVETFSQEVIWEK